MTDKKPEAKIVKATPVFQGFLKITNYEIEKDLHEGGTMTSTWQIMDRGNAVGVLAYDPDEDLVVLVNEMRAGLLAAGDYPYSDTLPAGGIAKGEGAIVAAEREMIEETGLTLKDAKIIHDKAYVSAGGTSESISIVFGIVAAKGNTGTVHGLADEHENIRTRAVTSTELMDRIRSGDINDMKTMIAGYWLNEHKDEIRKSRKAGLTP